MRRFNPRVREEVKRNRRQVINNTGEQLTGEGLVKEIYKMMDRKKADECIINAVTATGVEVDLFQNGKIVEWGCPIFAVKE